MTYWILECAYGHFYSQDARDGMPTTCAMCGRNAFVRRFQTNI